MEKNSENLYWLNNIFLPDLLENLPSHVFWKDKEGIYLGCNSAFAHSLGMEKPEDIIGKSDYDLPVSKENSDSFRKDDREVMISRQPKLNIEETQILNDGREVFLLTSKVPLFDKNNEIIGVLGIYSDITEMKQSQTALERTKYQLKGAQLVSASIAHEIRTPLATIKANVSFAKYLVEAIYNEIAEYEIKTPNINEKNLLELKESINMINEKTDQSNAVINMLLTKLQSFEFEVSNFDNFLAADCIEESLKEFIVPIDMVGKIKFVKDNNFAILGNQTIIKHVIMNFLKNAIYFIQKANKGKIIIWLENKLDTNEIHFKDTAFGINEEVLPHIFKPFFTTETSTGTGVGLAFGKMVMESHQGNITCSSREGEYTEFILSFPKRDKITQ